MGFEPGVVDSNPIWNSDFLFRTDDNNTPNNTKSLVSFWYFGDLKSSLICSLLSKKAASSFICITINSFVPLFPPLPHPSVCGRQRCIYFISVFQTLREVFSKPEVKYLDNLKKIEMATAFDTMWAIILALKEASIELSTSEWPLKYNVENIHGKESITETIKSKLRNVSFEGLTVIAFHFFFILLFSAVKFTFFMSWCCSFICEDICWMMTQVTTIIIIIIIITQS